MARTVKVGDAVRLKHTMWDMLVEEVKVNGYTVVWLDSGGEPHRETYSADLLNFVNPEADEARFKNKPTPPDEPVTVEIKDDELPF